MYLFSTFKKCISNKSLIDWKSNVSIFLVSFIFSAGVYANPVLDNVAAGNVSVQQSPNSTVINQSSSQAIINWQSFNIGKQESTHFQQPTGGMTLNRINPGDGASQIYGHLSATGQIILMNPAGIFFGPSAYVNVGGLIATTHNITDENFLKGNFQFSKVPGYNGSIINEGQLIAANHGLIALVGSGVSNSGLIKANLGHVVLASGDAFTVNFQGNDMINFSITKPTSSPGVDKNGKSLTNGVSNTGKLIANGGQVLVTAQAAQGILDNVINMGGIIEAKSVGIHNGEIIISGDNNAGVVRIASKINASGKKAGQKGGTVEVTGYDILLDSPTVIDVSGNVGGGNIYIGGNYHGAGPLPNANAVVMNAGAKLLANAITNGNGGNIVLWSDNVTKAYGSIIAQGGVLGGNGGSVETSSENYLDVNGLRVNLLATNGNTGNWLLDPADLTICANCNSTSPLSGIFFQPSSGVGNSFLLNTDLNAALATANITLETTGSITGTGTGSINVNAPITWNSNRTLTLSAFNSINISAPITLNTNGGLTLTTNNNIGGTSSGGTLNFLNGGNFQLNPAAALNINGASYTTISSQSVLQNMTGSGNYALASNLNASSWVGFSPITSFSGNFNGLGNSISNLTINSASTFVGLFGQNSGTISNIGLINLSVTSTGSSTIVGGLVGQNNAAGTIFNAYVTGNISGGATSSIVGGLAGNNSGTISNTYSNGSVSSSSSNILVAGLIGSMQGFGTLSNSYSSANVNSTGAGSSLNIAGGLVGFVTGNGRVNTSYATGTVSATSGSTTGGLVGWNNNIISGSYWNNSVNATGVGLGSSAGATGLSNLQLTAGGLPSGFLSSVWGNGNNQTSPYLLNLNNVNSVLMSGSTTTFYTAVLNMSQLQAVNNNLSGKFILGNVLDASGYTFTPIGSSFTGLFNGLTNTISNLTINSSSNGVGLFSGIGAGGTVENLGLNNVSITGTGNSTGGLAGSSAGTILNTFVNGTVSGGAQGTGGLVGQDTGAISSSYAGGTVIGSNFVGGLVGFLVGGTVTDSYSTANVSGVQGIGGLVGSSASGSVNTTYASGNVSASTTNGVGGLVGSNGTSVVTNSYWDTTTTNQSAGTGFGPTSGMTGENTAAMMNISTFSGWSITSTPSATSSIPASTWFIFNVGGVTRPMLLSEWSTQVTNAHQLQLMGAVIGPNTNYVLQNNINLSSAMTNASDVWGTNRNASTGAGFVPIGIFSGSASSLFQGNFNGQSHIISNLYIVESGSVNTGLFSEINNSSSLIQNIGLTNALVIGGGNPGHTGILIGLLDTGSVNNVFTSGDVLSAGAGSGSVGGLIGDMLSGSALSNAYSTADVIGNASNFVGGLVPVATSGSTISNVFSSGYVSGDAGLVGGLIANSGGTVSNAYWDKTTSGISTSAAGTGIDTATLQASLPTGFSTSTWGLITNLSLPYLSSFYTSTPRVFAGTTPSGLAANSAISLVANGSVIDGTYSNADHTFYFLDPNNTVVDNSGFLLYVNNGSQLSNLVGVTPTSGGSMADLNLSVLNTLQIGDAANSATINASQMSTVLGSLSSPFILYTASGNNITLNNNVNLVEASSYTLNLDGNFTLNSTGASTLAGLSGSGALNVTNGSLTVNASNSGYTGTITASNTTLIDSALVNALGVGTLNLNNNSSVQALTSINLSNSNIVIGDGTTATFSGSGGINIGLSSSNIMIGSTSASSLLKITNTAGVSLNGSISGPGGITLNASTASVTVLGSNSYTGATNIIAGLYELISANSLGNTTNFTSGVTVANGGQLSVSTSQTASPNISLVGSGTGGNGALSIFGLGVTMGSAISLSGNAAIGAFSGTSLALTNTINNNGFNLNVVGGGNMSFSNTITGSGNLSFNNSGVITLSGTNSYTGQTSVNAGNLVLNSAGALGNGTNNTSSVSVAGGAQLTLSNINYTAAPTLSLNGTGVSGNGALYESATSGSGTLASAISLTGAATIGTAAGGTLNLSTSSSSINNNGNLLTVTGGNTNLLGNITGSGGLTENNSGSIVTLSGSNSYTGATNVTAGILSATSTAALGNATNHTSSVTVANGAELSIGISSILGTPTLNLTGTGVSNAGALSLNAANIALNTPINLTGDTTISGSGSGVMNLTGAISGANNLTINLSNAGISLPAITLASSKNLSVTTNGALTTNGVISSANSVALTTLNSGNLTVGANIATTGGPITLNAANSSGTATTLLINNGVTLSSGSGSGGTLILGGGVNLGLSTINVGTGNISLQGNGNNLFIAGTFNSPITFNVTGTITVTGNISTTNNAINFNSPTILSSAATINAGTAPITFSSTLAVNAATTLQGAAITIQNALSGSQNLSINGSNAAAALNTLTLNTGSTQNWLINSGDGGSVSGLSGYTGNLAFSNIGNLTGSGSSNNFHFTTGTIAGNLTGNGSDTLSYIGNAGILNVNLQTAKASDIVGTFSGINNFIGSDGTTGTNSTLTGLNAANTWAMSATANSGSVGANTFSGFGNLTGGSGNDIFNFAVGSISGNLIGGGGADSLSYLTRSGAVNVNLQTASATGIGGTFSAINTFAGNDGTTGTNSTLTGANATNTWTMSATANSGSVGGNTFSGFGNLTGGTGSDSFNFAVGSIAGNLIGGGGADTLSYLTRSGAVNVNLQTARATGIGGTFSGINTFAGNDGTTGSNNTFTGANIANTWTMSAANAGSVGGNTFSGFGNLTGGTGNDTFDFSAGSIVGNVIGGGGSDTLSYATRAGAVNVNLQTASATGIGGTFSGINTFAGNDGTTGANSTLTGANTTNTWTMSATANSGSVGGNTFSGFGNLTGGTGSDIFNFNTGSISHNLIGGGGADSLTYASRTGTVSVNLQSATATGIGGTFSGINTFAGNDGTTGANSTLTGANTTNTWTMSATANSGSVAGNTFSGFGNVTGGTGNDTFNFAVGSIAGNLIGSGGADSLSYATRTGVVNVNLQTASATGIGGTFSGINTFAGNDGTTGTNSTLAGANTTNTWTMSATANSGSVAGNTFSGFGNLSGGSVSDIFNFATGSIAGNLIGGSGTESLTYAGRSGVVNVNLQTASATGIGGTFSGITSFTGNDATSATHNSSLTGANATNSWTINALNGGSVGSNNFSAFANLIGGTGNDTFSFANTSAAVNSINGGTGGGNTLNFANDTTATSFALTGSVAANGFTGTANNSIANGFQNINTITGSSTANISLTAENTANTWNVSSNNGGTLNDGTATLSFGNFGNLVGGTAADTFNFSDGVGVNTVNGGAGANTLNLANYSTPINIVLNGSSANGFSGSSSGAINPISSGFASFSTITGSATANNTLTAENTANTWTMSATANSGSLNDSSNTLAFNNFGNLSGGSVSDIFNFATGSIAGNLIGGSGTESLTYAGRSGLVNVNLQTASATGIGGTFSAINTFTGNDATSATHNSSITGANAANTWTINALNGGSVGSNNFSAFANLSGGTGNDTFSFANTSAAVNSINGGTGGGNTLDFANDTTATSFALTGSVATDGFTGTANNSIANGFQNINAITGSSTANISLTAANTANTWNVSSNNGGTLNDGTATLSFGNFGNLVGGAAADTFNFSDGVGVTTVNGGAGANTLNLANYSTPINIVLNGSSANGFSGSSSGAINPISSGFASLGTITGSATANNTLTAENTANTWTIGGANTGTLNDGSNSLAFNNFGNLSGGTNNDIFNFSAGSIAGNLIGGGGVDTLSYASRAGAVSIDLQAATATGIGGTFSGITAFTGNSNSSLSDTSGGNTWNINTANSTVGGNTFNSFANLVGGNGDSFNFADGASIVGNISATNGTLNESAYTTPVNVNLQTAHATGIGGTFSGINNFVGSDTLSGSNSTLTGADAANTWTISAANGGNVGGNNFSGFGNLTGGTGSNDFVFNNGMRISGNLTGGTGGNNLLDISAYTTPTNVVLTGATSFGSSGTTNGAINPVNGFANITQINNTTSGTNSLTGANTNNTWTINSNSGFVNNGLSTLAYNNFQNLTGGAANDNFTINSGTVSGSINGGAGNNTLAAQQGNNTWQIINANSGTVTAVSSGFSNIQNLSGGTGSNNFIFAANGTISGNLTSGGNATLDLSSKIAAPVSVNLQSGTATAIGGVFSGINNFIGTDNASGSNSSLIGSNNNNTWGINTTNNGSVGAVNFTNFGNLTGGTSNNTFIFANQTKLTGLLNGGSLNANNDIVYTSYTSAISTQLSSLYQGTVTANNGVITNFININHSNFNSGLKNTLTVPAGKNTLVFTGAQTGYVNDPFFFSGISNFIATPGSGSTATFTGSVTFNPTNNTYTYQGSTLSLTNFNVIGGDDDIVLPVSISSVIAQGNGSVQSPNPLIQFVNTVDQNINDLVNQASEDFDTNLSKVKINPFCSQAN